MFYIRDPLCIGGLNLPDLVRRGFNNGKWIWLKVIHDDTLSFWFLSLYIRLHWNVLIKNLFKIFFFEIRIREGVSRIQIMKAGWNFVFDWKNSKGSNDWICPLGERGREKIDTFLPLFPMGEKAKVIIHTYIKWWIHAVFRLC